MRQLPIVRSLAAWARLKPITLCAYLPVPESNKKEYFGVPSTLYKYLKMAFLICGSVLVPDTLTL